jgi:cytochrome c556
MMEKLLSGASSGGRTKSSLAHQQRLFDLAEAVARRLAVELVGAAGRGELPYDAEQDLRYQIDTAFDRAQRELTDLQQRYSAETRSGEDRAEERRWAEEIARMFDEATAALAAALGEGGDP